MRMKTVEDVDVGGETVLVRADFNVPLDRESGRVLDTSRIEATLPTIDHLLQNCAKLVLCSHLGRPKGKVDQSLSLAPIASTLSDLLNEKVSFVGDCIGAEVEEAVEAMSAGDVLLLENLRFHPEEEKNDVEFAKRLASLANVYVNDAFGAAHRAHASVSAVTRFLPSAAGLLMKREIENLGRALSTSERPFVSISGGAKIGDKMAVLKSLLNRVDLLLIGGGMAASFLKARGMEVGQSLIDEAGVEFARDLLRQAGQKLVLPTDFVLADDFKETAQSRAALAEDVGPHEYIMDVGPRTLALFEEKLRGSKLVLWNGPMGVYEWKAFSRGTEQIARCLAELSGAITIVGGGSTAAAVRDLGLDSRMTHVSTGGGASLEFLEGRDLPGVTALMEK